MLFFFLFLLLVLRQVSEMNVQVVPMPFLAEVLQSIAVDDSLAIRTRRAGQLEPLRRRSRKQVASAARPAAKTVD